MTQLKEMQDALASIRERLVDAYDVGVLVRAFLKYSPAASIMLDREGRTLLWTKKLVDEFSLHDFGDLSNIHIKVVLPEFYSSAIFHQLVDEVAEGSGVVSTRAGQTYEFTANTWPLNGKMGGVLITLVDRTAHYNLIRKLQEIPQHVTCSDSSQCLWKSAYGADILRLARKAISE